MTLTVAGCDPSPTLPGGFKVSYGDRGKAWLQNPNGTIAHAGLIKRLYSDGRHILLVGFAVQYGGEAAAPFSIDDTCYVALLIDGPTQRVAQIKMADAERFARKMTEIEAYDRQCLKGMPNT